MSWAPSSNSLFTREVPQLPPDPPSYAPGNYTTPEVPEEDPPSYNSSNPVPSVFFVTPEEVSKSSTIIEEPLEKDKCVATWIKVLLYLVLPIYAILRFHCRFTATYTYAKTNFLFFHVFAFHLYYQTMYCSNIETLDAIFLLIFYLIACCIIWSSLAGLKTKCQTTQQMIFGLCVAILSLYVLIAQALILADPMEMASKPLEVPFLLVRHCATVALLIGYWSFSSYYTEYYIFVQTYRENGDLFAYWICGKHALFAFVSMIMASKYSYIHPVYLLFLIITAATLTHNLIIIAFSVQNIVRPHQQTQEQYKKYPFHNPIANGVVKVIPRTSNCL
ncbi:hypothetical protein CAEBREN_01618 [Caenorhabditis brenneri]|uniref:Uncharacterized protein n=1 Tax=Caenorhabditis brenneri TaxID=135651 RepID=G0NFS0_CAEBE|nr:hypothetical protein CAEBREN_01618 [Caenorhabditis brenneri]